MAVAGATTWGVTVTYQSAATVEAALRSVLAAGAAGAVVVDNASSDRSADLAAAVDPDRVVVFRSADNLGFGAGCNAGVALVPDDVELVLLLNPDATIDAADLAALVEHLEGHPRCALVGPALRRSGSPLPSSGGPATFATEARAFLPRPAWRLLPDRRTPPGAAVTGPVAYVEGACMLVRRAAFEAVGGFDEDYFLYFEELDLGNRLRAAGFEVHHVEGATAEHLVGTSIGRTSFGGRPFLYESTVRYLRRWRPRWEAHAYRAALTLGFGLRVLARQATREELRTYRRAAARGMRRRER